MTNPSDISGLSTNGGRWQKGQSGNPAGRPRNSRSRLAAILDAAAEADAAGVYAAIRDAALKGDSAAQGLLMARWWPITKRSFVSLDDLPPIATARDVGAACALLVRRVALGELALEEAAALSELLERLQKSLLAVDFEARIAALEAAHQAGGEP